MVNWPLPTMQAALTPQDLNCKAAPGLNPLCLSGLRVLRLTSPFLGTVTEDSLPVPGMFQTSGRDFERCP